MNRFFSVLIITGFLGSYFIFSLIVFPSVYLSKEELKPQPFFDVKISTDSINLGDSFDVHIFSENIGDYGDIHILSVGFPKLEKIDEQIKVIHHDFNHNYSFINKGTVLGAKYSGGVEKVESEYASIEIMNRPSPPHGHYTLDLSIIPNTPGMFEIYIKSVEIPHSSDLSHYPQVGFLDPQGEHVSVYSIMVNP